MIGRPADDKCRKTSFHPLYYESSITSFVKIDVNHGLAMAIDQEGEIWALCGKQGFWLNAGLPAKQVDRKPVGLEAIQRTVFVPVRTGIMTKLQSKALDIQIGAEKTYVLAEDSSG